MSSIFLHTCAFTIALTTLAPTPSSAQSGADLAAPTRAVRQDAADRGGLTTLDLRILQDRRADLGPHLLGGGLLVALGVAALLGGVGMVFGSLECAPTSDPSRTACINDGELLSGGISSAVLGLASLIPGAIWLASANAERHSLDRELRRRRLVLHFGASPTGARIGLRVRF